MISPRPCHNRVRALAEQLRLALRDNCLEAKYRVDNPVEVAWVPAAHLVSRNRLVFSRLALVRHQAPARRVSNVFLNCELSSLVSSSMKGLNRWNN